MNVVLVVVDIRVGSKKVLKYTRPLSQELILRLRVHGEERKERMVLGGWQMEDRGRVARDLRNCASSRPHVRDVCHIASPPFIILHSLCDWVKYKYT